MCELSVNFFINSLYFTLFYFLWIFRVDLALSFALLLFVWVFVVCFSFFFSPHGFPVFYLHEFSGFFCKFNCSWHFFTSSGHVPPGGWLHSASISRTGIEG